MSERLLRAALHAARLHAGQTRKGGEVPYVNHVIEVAHLVAADGAGEDAAVAALLHDVVEDTEETVAGIGAAFGPEVAALVDALTDRPGWTDLPRRERKRQQAGHLGGADPEARRIKVADQISNLRDVSRLPAGWTRAEAEDYAAGTALVVAACAEAAPALADLHGREMAAFLAGPPHDGHTVEDADAAR